MLPFNYLISYLQHLIRFSYPIKGQWVNMLIEKSLGKLVIYMWYWKGNVFFSHLFYMQIITLLNSLIYITCDISSLINVLEYKVLYFGWDEVAPLRKFWMPIYRLKLPKMSPSPVVLSVLRWQAVSPDGEAIVTGAGDETLRFWNVFSKTRCTKVQSNRVQHNHQTVWRLCCWKLLNDCILGISCVDKFDGTMPTFVRNCVETTAFPLKVLWNRTDKLAWQKLSASFPG